MPFDCSPISHKWFIILIFEKLCVDRISYELPEYHKKSNGHTEFLSLHIFEMLMKGQELLLQAKARLRGRCFTLHKQTGLQPTSKSKVL